MIMRKIVVRAGFTLVEVLVALSVSGILLTVLITTFFDTYVFSQEMAVRASLLQDSKVIFDSIAREVESGRIDYEEYFNQCVIKNNCPNSESYNSATGDLYGDKHGMYAWQFYDGGYFFDTNGVRRVDGAGSLCQRRFGTGFEVVRAPNPDCVSGVLSYSDDFNTGVFDGPLSSSVCASSYRQISNTDVNGVNVSPLSVVSGNGPCDGRESNVFEELYLLSGDGQRKVIFGREKVSEDVDSYALSKVELVSDLSEFWGAQSLTNFVCSDEYDCSNPLNAGKTMVDRGDLSGGNIFSDFLPVSPLKVSVESLRFIIQPLEDPVRAFGEFSEEVQVAPKVTILMTLKGSPEYYFFGLGEEYTLSLQRTVVAGGI